MKYSEVKSKQQMIRYIEEKKSSLSYNGSQRFTSPEYPEYSWELDTGHKNTAIQILDDEGGTILYPPESYDGRIFVPDIYSHRRKIAIEYQEQPKRRKHRGRLSKKGHTEFSDLEKDLYYKLADIEQIKIWDDDISWKDTLRKHLS